MKLKFEECQSRYYSAIFWCVFSTTNHRLNNVLYAHIYILNTQGQRDHLNDVPWMVYIKHYSLYTLFTYVNSLLYYWTEHGKTSNLKKNTEDHCWLYVSIHRNRPFILSRLLSWRLRRLRKYRGVGLEGVAIPSICIYNALFTANQTHPSFLAMCPKNG